MENKLYSLSEKIAFGNEWEDLHNDPEFIEHLKQQYVDALNHLEMKAKKLEPKYNIKSFSHRVIRSVRLSAKKEKMCRGVTSP